MGAFDLYTRYNRDASIRSLVFGEKLPILETDLNEMQEIQIDHINNTLKRVVTNGYTEGGTIEFNSGVLTITDQGFIVNGEYIFVDSLTLSVPNSNSVYLDVFIDEVTYSDDLQKYGNEQSAIILDNYLLDARVGVETTRRRIRKYNLSLVNNVSEHEYLKIGDVDSEGNFTKLVPLAGVLTNKFSTYRNKVTLNSETNTFNINIPEFDLDRDILEIYQNSTYMDLDYDYTISEYQQGRIDKVSGTWESGTIFSIVVYKDFNNSPNISSGTTIENGTVSIEKLDQSTQDKINANVGQIVKYTGRLTIPTSDPTNIVDVGNTVSAFDSSTDLLMVFQNSTLKQNGLDYTIAGNTITKSSGNWGEDFDTVLDFVVIKSISEIPLETFSGSLITDETVSKSKLSEALQNEITSAKMIILNGTVTILSTSPTNTVNISTYVTEYSDTEDYVMIFQNGTYTYEGVNYTRTGSVITKSTGNWGEDFDTVLEFIVLKKASVAPLDTYSGSQMTDGTLEKVKLATALTTELDNLQRGKNVKNYDITGSGITDDTVKLQAFFDALASGESAYISQGTYLLSSSITVSNKHNITIYADSKAVFKANSNGLTNMFDFTTCNNLTIKGIDFDDDLKGRTCIRLTSCNNFNIEKCYFTGYSAEYSHAANDSAILIRTSVGGKINKNTFEEFGDQYDTTTATLNRCITLDDTSTDNIIITTNIINAVNQGMVIAGGHRNIISDNTFTDVQDNSIYVLPDVSGLTISDNKFITGRDEAIVTGGDNVHISDNTFKNISNKAIAFAFTDSNNVTICNNDFINDDNTITGDAIRVRDADTQTLVNVKIVHNTFKGYYGYSVLYFDTATRLRIVDNDFDVTIPTASNHIILVGNNSSYVKIKDNVVNQSGGGANIYGIRVNSSSCPSSEINNNVLNGCRGDKGTSGNGVKLISQSQSNSLQYFTSPLISILDSIAIPAADDCDDLSYSFNAAPARGANLGWVKISGSWYKFGDIDLSNSATYDPPSIASMGTTTTTITVTGAALGNKAEAWMNKDQGGVIISAYVSATDTVTVVLFNPTGAPVDIASGTIYAKVVKQ